jgi:hypothetical protein
VAPTNRRGIDAGLFRLRQRAGLFGTAPDDLNDYVRRPARRVKRAAKADPTGWTVTDNWPSDVPVTEAEVDVFEAWFGNLFD